MNIYVGNLSRDVTDEDLKELFAPFGEVSSVTIIKDKLSGESRGFAFLELMGKADAYSAINELNGKELKGRNLKVSKAKPREDRRPGQDRGGHSHGRRNQGFRRFSR